MSLTSRDRLIVLTVGTFGQLSAGHVRSLFFLGKNSTPAKRSLLRLAQRKYLARIERPLIGGDGGGSGQYVYQLGSEGWKLCRIEKKYSPYRAVNYHMLAVVSVYVELKELEKNDRFTVTGYSAEPDTWRTIAGVDLRPDLHVEVADHTLRRSLSWWLEVDMGTERQKQLKDKMAGYYHAWRHAQEEDITTFPLVVFLVPDERRVNELRWLISHGPVEAQALFDVQLQSEFPHALLGV